MFKKFVKELATYLPSQILPALTAFITTPILTRLFPPAEYGFWALALSISAFLVALAVSGFGSAVIRFFPIYQAELNLKVFFATIGVTTGMIIAAVAVIGFLFFFLFSGILNPELTQLLPLIILIFVAQSIFTVFMSVMRVQGQSNLFTFFQLFANYGGLGIGLVLVVFFDFRVDGLLWGVLLTLILTLPFMISLSLKGVGIHLQHFRFSDALQIWQYAWPLALGNVAMWGLRVSDLWIISLFRPQHDVGLYSASYNISAKSIELLVMLFLLSVSPLIFSAWENEGKEITEKALTMVTRVYLIVCLPAAVGLSVLAYPFVVLLTSQNFYEGFKIVGFVAFSSFAWGLSNIAMMGLAIKKQAYRLGVNQVIAVFTHISLQLLLVPRYGYMGAAISTLIGYTVLFVLQTLASSPYLTWRFPFITLRNVVIASGAMGLVAWSVYGICNIAGENSPIFLFLSIVVAGLFYVVCLLWLGEVKEDEINAATEFLVGKKEESLIKSLAHYTYRSWELGPVGVFQRIWGRIINKLSLWWQSLWWGWMSRNEMSDARLLAHTTGDWRSVEALLDHLAGRSASSFLLPHESPQETAALLNRHYPEHVSAILATADAACRNEICLQDQVFHYPQGIDWHREPVTGFQYPLWHRSRFIQDLLSATRPTDIRKFWELNRHQHFITLGMAYWLTGDSRYVDAFSSQIQSWIKNNPLQQGANWCLGIEISLRILAWTTAFQFFRNSPEFRKKTGNIFLKSLWQQADFLSTHLQTTRTDVPNNQMIAELAGLVLVGTAFPEFRAAASWRETGLRLLDQQMSAQTHPDGVNKEQATGYHRFVAELLLLVVARNRQEEKPQNLPVLAHTLEGMLDYVLFTLTPIGTSPMWGDSASGRALCLGKNKAFWDFRPLLSAGAALFGRTDWKSAAGRFDEEAFWLLGSDGLNLWEQLDTYPPKQTSQAFPHAGLYVIRDSWKADTDVAFFRCGPFGLGGEGHCAHAHSDLLSFVLWVSGQPLLVDPGTYIYHGPWRDYFRLTAAHNTVMVDGCEQAGPRPYFNWNQIPAARCTEWAGERITAAMTLAGHVNFIRELTHTQPGVWILDDKFNGKDEHKIEWFFNFAPGLDFELLESDRTLKVLKQGLPFLTIHIPDNGIDVQMVDAWYSDQYGIKQCIKRLHAQRQGRLKENEEIFRWQFKLIDAESVTKRGEYVAVA